MSYELLAHALIQRQQDADNNNRAPFSPRPRRYHRRDRSWELALRRLHAMGLSDQLIADHLTDLDADSIRTLEHEGWTKDRLERIAKSSPGIATPDGQPFTARQVRHHRRRLSLPRNPYQYEVGMSPASLMAFHRNYLVACELGFGHLVGQSEAIREATAEFERTPSESAEDFFARVHAFLYANKLPRMLKGHTPASLVAMTLDQRVTLYLPGWTADMVRCWRANPWDSLRPTEVRVLRSLLDDGPQTRKELAARLHVRRWWGGDRDYLSWLVKVGLVVAGDGRYSIAPGVGLRPRSSWDTAGERG
jgi:hypothetical protein